jgi:hypothetical protein
LTRLTSGSAFKYHAAWRPDSRYLFFASGPVAAAPGIHFDIHGRAADGTGPEEKWTESLKGGFPMFVLPGGRSLVNAGYLPNENLGLMAMPFSKESPSPLFPDSKSPQL